MVRILGKAGVAVAVAVVAVTLYPLMMGGIIRGRQPRGGVSEFAVTAAAASEAGRGGGGEEGGTLVACVGDSLTHGLLSHDWVEDLRSRMGVQGVQFVNDGINSQSSWHVVQRLDSVLDLRPNAVVVLVGTNDAMGSLGDNALSQRVYQGQYASWGQVPSQPLSLKFYEDNLREVLERLRDAGVKRAVSTLPPLGENNASSVANTHVADFNEVIERVAAETGASVLDTNSKLWEGIQQRRKEEGGAAATGAGLADFRSVYEEALLMVASAYRYYLLRGTTWDDVATANGGIFMTDKVA